jgi:hypothetical protein
MTTSLEITSATTLQEGIVGCIIAANYINGYPSPDAYDRILDAVAGRELFLDADIIKLIKSQTALWYVLEDDFLQSSCEKITEEWKRPVFTMVCHLLIDNGLTATAIEFLKALKAKLGIEDVRDLIEVLGLLHKDRCTKLLYSI